jgi:hypothetical protein
VEYAVVAGNGIVEVDADAHGYLSGPDASSSILNITS